MNPFILEQPLLENIFRKYSRELGDDFPMYRGHCYRLINYVIYLQKHQNNLDFLGVAIAFHDIGIWTHKTMDYLDPSLELAVKYCNKNNLDISKSDLKSTILNHHKISKLHRVASAEFLRRADLVDLSFGMIRGGVDTLLIKTSKECWPYLNFQKKIIGKVMVHAVGNPFNPFPMLKW